MIKKIYVILIFLFILLWLYDSFSTSFNPEYKPLIEFLKVMETLIETA